MSAVCFSIKGWKQWGYGLFMLIAWALSASSHAQQTAPAQAPAPPSPAPGREVDLASPPALVDPAAPSVAEPVEDIPAAPPPLSIVDAINSLRAGVDLIERPSTIPLEKKRERIEFMLGSVIRYVERLDRARPTLPYYQWERISAEKVDRTNPDPRLITLTQPVPGVTAVAFKANNSDLELRKVTTIDTKGGRWEFNTKIPLAADQPRQEICFLPLATELKSIEVVFKRLEPKERDPRLLVDIGVCEIEESGKESVYFMHLTRDCLKKGKPGDAALNLKRAIKSLESFKASRRL